MKNFIVILFLIIFSKGFSQKYPFWKNYELTKNQEQTSYDEADQLYYYTKFLAAVEYEYDPTYRQFYKYYTEHYRVKLQTDLAIDEFNKIYISLENAVAVKSVQARIIRQKEVIELDIEMEEFYSDAEENQYQYFPVSGLEMGDELEILYTVKMEPDYEGDQFSFQGEIPIYNFDFYFICDVDSKFDFKGHGGFPTPKKVDTILHRNQWHSRIDTIPALRSEYFSEYANNSMKLDVALTATSSGTEEDYSPFEKFSEILNYVYNVEYSKKERTAIHALNERLGVHNSRNTKNRIRLIEDYMKIDFDMYVRNPKATFLDIVQRGEGAVKDGIQVYMALFDDAQIAYEHGFTTDRYETTFDPTLESQYFLQKNFFYFPDVDEYLAPIDYSSRMGYLNPDWVPNNAFFAKYVSYPRSVEFEIKKITGTKAKDNTDSTIINIKLADNLIDFEIQVERYLMGYSVGENQLYYDIYRDQKRKKIEQDLINTIDNSSTFELTSLENMNQESAFSKAVIAKGKVIDLSTTLIENAGDLTIFKLGEIFGEYTDIGEIERKKFDFIFGKESIESTTINIELPAGVSVLNPNSIKVSKNIATSDNVFIQPSFEINDNVITYSLKEHWLSTQYSIDEKDDLLNVFNFYADLSKMNLILK